MIETSLVDHKVEQLKAAFQAIDPSQELTVDDNGAGGKLVYGPFPSFIILVDGVGPMRALVHVNADAPNMILCFQKFFKDLNIEFDGPFAVNGESGELIMGPDAYAKKEENIMMFAADIIQRRKAKEQEGLYVPEEKKIILA
jgi:hypothetical protein